jgi:hypothetical protein
MVAVGLNVLTVGLENSVDHMMNYSSLLSIIKDLLYRNLLSANYKLKY